jgi:glyoxylase-like metal-dependent hydrolase (beta-lactamase superfamily II)
MAARAGAQSMMRRAAGTGFVSTFSDGALNLGPAADAFPGTDPAELSRLFADAGLDPAAILPPLNVTLLETGGRVALFDAGSGAGFQASAGRLAAALEAGGVAADSVTDIVFTHAHPDHLWGVLDEFDEIAFPSAAFHMPRIEWDFWRGDAAFAAVGEARQTFVAGARRRFEAIDGRVTLIEAGAEVLPGVEAVAAHGHTPGHMAYAIHGGEGLMVVGDALAHRVMSFARPRAMSAMDQDGAMAAATRLTLLDRLAADRMAVIGYHLPEPGLGWVDRSGEAYALAM